MTRDNILDDLAYVLDKERYVGPIWETCRNLYRELAADRARIEELEKAVRAHAEPPEFCPICREVLSDDTD